MFTCFLRSSAPFRKRMQSYGRITKQPNLCSGFNLFYHSSRSLATTIGLASRKRVQNYSFLPKPPNILMENYVAKHKFNPYSHSMHFQPKIYTYNICIKKPKHSSKPKNQNDESAKTLLYGLFFVTLAMISAIFADGKSRSS